MKKLALPIKIQKKTGRILDIGSGNNCLDIATHLMDLMPDKNAERAGDLETVAGKIFRVGSIENIPFEDKYFDFVHASHVLEHVDHPEKAISEMRRVGSAGYIETPAGIMEKGLYNSKNPGERGWSFHRWMVWRFPEEDKLYLQPKTPKNVFTFCGCEAGQQMKTIIEMTSLDAIDSLIPYACRMTQMVWRDSISFEIWRDDQVGSGELKTCRCESAAFVANLRTYFASWRYFSKRHKFKKIQPEIFGRLTKTLTSFDKSLVRC